MPEFQTIKIDKVDVMDMQTRSNLGDLTDLTASIAARGVQEPVLVKALDSGRFELFAGQRRLESSKKAGLTDIPALVHPRRKVTRQMMLELNMVENVQRDDLNAIDEAKGFEKLQTEFGLSDDEVCSRLGIKKKRLKDRKRLLKMADVVQEAILNCRITLKAAFEIDRLPKDRQGKFVRIAEELKGGRLTKMVDKELEKIENKAGAKDKKPPPDKDKAAVTEMIRTLRKAGQVACNGLGYDDMKKQRVKEVNFRLLEMDDLKVVTQFVDDIADQVPDDVDCNEKAEAEIVAAVEGPRALNVEWPTVRAGLVDMVMRRAREKAFDNASGSGKRPKITFAVAKEIIDKFFEEVTEEEETPSAE